MPLAFSTSLARMMRAKTSLVLELSYGLMGGVVLLLGCAFANWVMREDRTFVGKAVRNGGSVGSGGRGWCL
ncbi:hypothetical protein [Pasteuria penetrans]|uniref:hypothetical protein n=1 Tax=Pasteuria penetrans TaxID=86005 RepID=UPI0011EFA6A2|nr:hypothetical protein [Pasteuria penetrans]